MTLDELKKLEAAATPGPWALAAWTSHELDAGDDRIVPVDAWGQTRHDGPICDVFGQKGQPLENASLIAAMRNTLPDLIAAVEALREARDRERNPFDDGQTERYVRWSSILSRLGVE